MIAADICHYQADPRRSIKSGEGGVRLAPNDDDIHCLQFADDVYITFTAAEIQNVSVCERSNHLNRNENWFLATSYTTRNQRYVFSIQVHSHPTSISC